jgi:hypothetical protein
VNLTSPLQRLKRQALPRAVRDGDLAVVNSIEAFTLAAGHRMRAASCMLCHEAIGGKRVAVIGLAGLAGDACQCGGITGDLFVIHASHFPVDPQVITAALRAGVSCGLSHPVHL